MRASPRVIVLLAVALLAAVFCRLVYLGVQGELRFESDILSLLPEFEEDSPQARLEKHLLDELRHRVAFVVRGQDPVATDLATDFLVDRVLLAIEQESFHGALVDDGAIASFRKRLEAMLDYREVLLDEQSRRRMEDSANQQLMWRYRQVTRFPPANLTDPVRDPLGTLDGFVRQRLSPGENIRFNGLYTKVGQDELANLVHLELDRNLSAEEETGVVDAIFRFQSLVEREHPVAVYVSGYSLHQVTTRDRIRTELQWILLATTIATLAIFLFSTRSLLPLVVALSSIVISLAGGLVIAYEVTGISHILGLLLATTAIGIAVDFWLHFWIHVRAGHGGQQAIANIRPAVGVSFITTIAGLVAVALVAIPVLSYSAIFVCGALFINWLLVVYLIPPRVGKPATGDRIPAGRVLPRPVAWCLVVACAGVAVYGLATRYHVDDDPSRLIQQTPHLVEQDATVMGLLGARDAGRYLVIDAGSPDDLLDTEKDLLSTLGPDALSRVQAISRLVPDREMQIENRELYAETRNSLDDGLLNEYLSGIQLDSLQWEPPGKGFYPLLWVLDQPWADMERSRILHCDEELCQSFIRAPAGVLQQLEAKCGENPSCAIVDPSLNRSNAFLDLRTNLVRSFVFAIAAIFVVLFIRYRLRALPMLLPLLLASVTGLAVVALLGMPITVFSLAALFPLLGLSVDYSIFIAESRASVASTLYAILASAMTTFASFGILSLSSVPAVKYYSIPVAAGILVAWISAQLLISTDKSKDKGKNENKM